MGLHLTEDAPLTPVTDQKPGLLPFAITRCNVAQWLHCPKSESHINHLRNSFSVPGLVSVVVDGSEICSKAFGQARLDPPKSCTPDTLFDPASTSEAMTAIPTTTLVEDHEGYPNLEWYTPISLLLPYDFVMSDSEATSKLTIEDIGFGSSMMEGQCGWKCFRACHWR